MARSIVGSAVRYNSHQIDILSSSLLGLFYFGFLAWAFPTNFLMQRLPLGKYVGFKYCLRCPILNKEKSAAADISTVSFYGDFS